MARSRWTAFSHVAPGPASPAVGHHHGEALVGQPLRLQEGVLGLQHPLEVRASVWIEQHRQRWGRTRMAT